MHLQDEQVQRLLHDELEAAALATARAHLTACPQCRARLEEAEVEESRIFAQLEQLDHAPPALDAESLARRSRTRGKTYRWAAGIALLLAASGAALAVPGSPIPGWVSRAAERIGLSAGTPDQVSEPAADASESAGIAIAPGDRFTLIFELGAGSGRATVALTEGSEIIVRSLGGTASFTTGVDRLTVVSEGRPARFEVEVPRPATMVEIRVGGERVWLKDGSRIVTEAAIDPQGRYLVRLSASR